MTTDNTIELALKWWHSLTDAHKTAIKSLNGISNPVTDMEIVYLSSKEYKVTYFDTEFQEVRDRPKSHKFFPPDRIEFANSPTVSDEPGHDFDRGFTAGYNASAKSNASYEKGIAELKAENEQLKARLTEC